MLAMIDLDGPDPRTQAAFYGALLGWETVVAEDEYATVSGEGAPLLDPVGHPFCLCPR